MVACKQLDQRASPPEMVDDIDRTSSGMLLKETKRRREMMAIEGRVLLPSFLTEERS